MYNVMKTLIGKKYYATKEEAQSKLDVFFAMNRITEEEYVELTALAETVYAPEVVEEEVAELPVE